MWIIFQDQLLKSLMEKIILFPKRQKKTVPEPIGQRQLSEQLQGIFLDDDETI